MPPHDFADRRGQVAIRIWRRGQAVQLKPGANSVFLDPDNATPIN
jgi:hypothetical protein